MASIAQNTKTHAHVILNQFGNFTQEILGVFEAFMSKKDNRTFSEHVKIFKNTIDRYPLTVRSGLHSDLEKQANNLVQKFKKPFIKTQIVLQKYQGKNKKFAGSFVRDLRTALHLEKFFPNLIVELTSLEKEAIAQSDVKLVNVIKRLKKYIDQKKTAWNRKSQVELFSALCRRMDKR